MLIEADVRVLGKIARIEAASGEDLKCSDITAIRAIRATEEQRSAVDRLHKTITGTGIGYPPPFFEVFMKTRNLFYFMDELQNAVMQEKWSRQFR